jgi:hypothetical protein
MFDMFNSQYYKTLPEETKEKVRSSGKTFNSESDLREYVSTIQKAAH